MSKSLPDDPEMAEDDGPIKVSYHVAPGQDPLDDETEESEGKQSLRPGDLPSVSESAESAIAEDEEKDPLDDEDSLDEDTEEETDSDDEVPIKPKIIEDVIEEIPPEEEQEKPTETLYKNIGVSEYANPSRSSSKVYYLQTVKAGEQPEWQIPKEELDVFSQPIGGGLMQYWAYPKELEKTADSIPNAEAVATKNKSHNPVIIIDQVQDHLDPGCCLELILSQHGHALAKTDSNLDNLEANITSLIDLAKINFGLSVEHFISTSKVSAEVERRLDELEDAGGERENPDTAVQGDNFQHASLYQQQPPSLSAEPQRASTQKGGGSKVAITIPVLILTIMIGSIAFYRDSILAVLNPPPQKQEVVPVPTETPTPTPTVTIDRSKYKVRVLNGTSKSGAAGVLADELKEKGWLIDRTGNASSSAVPQSYIRGKVEIDEVIQALIEDVGSYEATPSAVILNPSDKADLEFVIGKK